MCKKQFAEFEIFKISTSFLTFTKSKTTTSQMDKYDIVIVGAGAAGLLAAGRAADIGMKVLVVEKMRQVGRKLLITGKGRCNITNDAEIKDFLENVYPDGRFLYPAFKRFFSKDLIELLNSLGVETVLERGGRYFPASNQASDIVDALLKRAKSLGVDFIFESRVKDLIIIDNKISGIVFHDNLTAHQINCNNVIICTGGKSYPATGSDGDGYKLAKSVGHTIIDVRPALVPLNTAGDLAQEMQGLSLKNVTASVMVNGKKLKSDFGEMLFTHFGLSGPIILSLSRLAVDELDKKNLVEFVVDLKPALDDEKLDIRLLRDLNENGKMKIENIFKLWLPSKMIPIFLKSLNLDPEKLGHQINGKERLEIKKLMKNLKFKITGHRSFKEAIITAGGVNTKEIDQKTMQSKIVSGLFFAGEVIDIDANTGGYNLQIAFSTAWLAAESCTKA
jgi:predicted Rossmann fold flavoprotein